MGNIHHRGAREDSLRLYIQAPNIRGQGEDRKGHKWPQFRGHPEKFTWFAGSEARCSNILQPNQNKVNILRSQFYNYKIAVRVEIRIIFISQ